MLGVSGSWGKAGPALRSLLFRVSRRTLKAADTSCVHSPHPLGANWRSGCLVLMKWWENFGKLGVAGKTWVQTSRSQSHSVGERVGSESTKSLIPQNSRTLVWDLWSQERQRFRMPSTDYQPWPVVRIILNRLENSMEMEKVWSVE